MIKRRLLINGADPARFRKGKRRIVMDSWRNVRGRKINHRLKRGVYIGLVRHTFRHWSKKGAEQMAWVLFDGNSGKSAVPYGDLRRER